MKKLFLMKFNDQVKVEIGWGLGHDWSELNRECLIDIFSRLNMEDRWTGPMLVCKPWMNACDDPSLNSVFDLETWFESSRRSNVWYSLDFEQKVDSFLRCVVDRSQGGLTEIRVRHCSDLSISYAAERSPNLEVLWIKNCLSVTDASMTKIASNCPNLKELKIGFSVEVSEKALKMVEKNCKNVKILMGANPLVRVSEDEASILGLSVRSVPRRELFEMIRQLDTHDSP